MKDGQATILVVPACYGFELERVNGGVCITQQSPISDNAVIYLEDHELRDLARACAEEFGWKLEFEEESLR